MAYDRNDRRYGVNQGQGYRPQNADRQYDRDRDQSYGRGYGGDYDRGRSGHGRSEHDRPDRDRGGYGRPPQGYDHDDRGFFDRAGDEVRSWFGDEEAERRRRLDERHAEREYERERGYGRDTYGRGSYGRETSGRPLDASVGFDAGAGLPSAGYGWNFRDRDEQGRGEQDRGDRHRDTNYRSWRDRQVESFDRDYDEYHRENQSKFDSDFVSYRTRRQGQRDSIGQVQEHQEVVGSDGAHVGKVDHVRNDRILLAKNDQDAGGHHHSIPSSWIEKVGDKVELNRTAAAAQQSWRDEEEKLSRSPGGGANLNRSFPGTY